MLSCTLRFAEPLVVNDLTLPEEADRVAHVGVVGEPEDIVVGGASLLLGSHILVQVGDDIALGLEIRHGEGRAGGCNWVDTGGMVDEVGVEAARLYLIYRESLGELIEYRGDDLYVCEFISTFMIYAGRYRA